jgi:hypothetical protein
MQKKHYSILFLHLPRILQELNNQNPYKRDSIHQIKGAIFL